MQFAKEEIEDLASALAEHLDSIIARGNVTRDCRDDLGWLDSEAAATYLGITRNALYKIAATGALGDCGQTKEGGKYFFRREQLDAYREGGKSEN